MPAPQQMSAQQALEYNAAARASCVNQGLRMTQNIISRSFDATSEQVINVAPRYVGLILCFIVRLRGNIANASGGVATRTPLGAANLIRQITLTDLNNQQRIQTAGWHMSLINSARQGFVFEGAYAPNVPVNYGNNWNIATCPSTINNAANSNFSYYYVVPCAYSLTDLRGAIYAGVVNATMNLQITVSTEAQAFSVGAADKTLAIFSSAAAGVTYGSDLTIDVFQVYLDQLPRRNDGTGLPFLPPLDLNNIYELKNTNMQGMVANQDFPMPYANYRQFLSTTVIFDNAGVLNVGSDINYWSLQAANFTNIFKFGPDEAALFARQTFMADPPQGVYYFDHRSAPINTLNYGNMELVMNASSVGGATAVNLIGYEDFSQVNQLIGAASLPGG